MVPPEFSVRSSSRSAVVALSLALVGAASLVHYHLELFMPRVLEVAKARNLAGGYAFGNDFYPVWLTAREWLREGRDPYSPEMTCEIQKGLFGRPLDPQIPSDPPTDYRTFAYPAFTDLLFWPAAWLPFTVARVLLVLVLAALTVTSVVFWMRAMAWRVNRLWLVVAFLLVLCSYQVLEGLYATQLGLMVGFFLAASMLALQRGQALLAGILIALTAIKPQMTILAIFYLLIWSSQDWGRRRRFVLGLFSAMFVLVGTATIFQPHWIANWTRVVLGYHRYAKPPLVSQVLTAPLGSSMALPASLALTVLLLFAAVVLAWRNRAASADSVQFWVTLSFLLCVTSVTLLPGQAIHDHVILLPGIFLLACRWRELSIGWTRRALFLIGVGILLWPWFAAFALVVLRPLLTHQQFYSKAIFALPLRTAAVFPFVVLGLLALARRTLLADQKTRVSLFS
jgi:hypothetical protein